MNCSFSFFAHLMRWARPVVVLLMTAGLSLAFAQDDSTLPPPAAASDEVMPPPPELEQEPPPLQESFEEEPPSAPESSSEASPPSGGSTAPGTAVVTIPASTENSADKTPKGSDAVDSGKELVNIDFPDPTDIKDIIKAIALWKGVNVILDRNVTGKVQIISPRKVTKEEAYQAFLSALNILNLTTVETGKIIKIMKVRSAVKGNLKTYLGSNWAPRTDEVITQIIPLKYIDAKQVQSTLSRIVSANAIIAYEPTNTLIVSDSGYKVRRVLEILELLDVQTQQPKVLIVPIKYSDPKSISDKVNQILQSAGKKGDSSYHSFKILIDERSNSVIIFGPPRTIKDVRELVKKFDMPLDDPASQATIHVRPLDYADAKKLSATLSSLASGAKSGPGHRPPPVSSANKTPGSASIADLGDGLKITSDDSSNSLLITGSRSAYDALNTLIRKLDVRRSQVFVEADILDLNEGNDFKFGTSIFAGYGKGSGTKSIVGWEAKGIGPLVVASSQATAAAGAAAGTVATGAAEKVAGAFATDMTIGVLSGKSVNVPGLGQFTPGALINMIKTDTNTKVLSSPHILTSNNEEASIAVGDKIFFNSSSFNAATGSSIPKVEKEDVDLTLNIKPNISHSNYVTMKIELESSSLKGSTPEGLPLITKRKSKQIVTVKDGQTVVISGLVSSLETESYSKIPLLGDIPILGWLFRNTSKKSERKNLVIFLTPHVVHGAEDLAAIYKAKLQERDEYLNRLYGSSFANSEFYKQAPTPEDGMYKPSKFDEIEDQRMKQQQEEIYKAIGYGQAEPASGASSEDIPATRNYEDIEASVPVSPGSEGGISSSPSDDGGGSPPPVMPPVDSELPPPPVDDHPDDEVRNE